MDAITELFKISSIALIFIAIVVGKLRGASKEQLLYSSILATGYFTLLSI